MRKTAIIMIAGFLGAGKTTVLNHLLDKVPDVAAGDAGTARIGVIVNEFGKTSVDAPFLAEKGYQVTELNNGSIFCQCLAATFIETMAQLLQYDLDYLLIEGSGLADPASMPVMMEQLKQKTERPYRYAGTICVIDAKYYRKLSQSLDTINRQILAASLVVVNKSDLVDEQTLADVCEHIGKRNPLARIVPISHGRLDPEHLVQMRRSRLTRRLSTLNTPASRPKTILLLTDDVLDQVRLATFSEKLSGEVYRIKGLVRLPDGVYRLDVVGRDFSLEPMKISCSRSEIIVIPQPGVQLHDCVASLARDILQVDAELE